MMELEEVGHDKQKPKSTAAVLFWIVAMNLVFSFDSILSAMALSDVFALPSVAVETFSNAALEAAAMGLPVVISDVGGAAEMFDQQPSARIYPRHDCVALASALQEILAKEAVGNRVRSETRAGILNRFSLAKMDANWLSTIRGVCADA